MIIWWLLIILLETISVTVNFRGEIANILNSWSSHMHLSRFHIGLSNIVAIWLLQLSCCHGSPPPPGGGCCGKRVFVLALLPVLVYAWVPCFEGGTLWTSTCFSAPNRLGQDFVGEILRCKRSKSVPVMWTFNFWNSGITKFCGTWYFMCCCFCGLSSHILLLICVGGFLWFLFIN